MRLVEFDEGIAPLALMTEYPIHHWFALEGGLGVV